MSQGQEDVTTYLSKKKEYELFLKNLKVQVQERKAVVLGEFDVAVDYAVAKILHDKVQSNDPNLLVIQALDQQNMTGTPSRFRKRACEYEEQTGQLTCLELVR